MNATEDNVFRTEITHPTAIIALTEASLCVASASITFFLALLSSRRYALNFYTYKNSSQTARKSPLYKHYFLATSGHERDWIIRHHARVNNCHHMG